eukprot:10792667-Alexandrium_andersonii.AAC.1
MAARAFALPPCATLKRLRDQLARRKAVVSPSTPPVSPASTHWVTKRTCSSTSLGPTSVFSPVAWAKAVGNCLSLIHI